jgi:hypothetical protein
MENASHPLSVRAGGHDDPDATRAAAVVGAYFKAEHASSFRRRVWTAVAVSALALWAVSVTTSALTGVDLAFGALLTGVLAVVATVAEVRERVRFASLRDRLERPRH